MKYVLLDLETVVRDKNDIAIVTTMRDDEAVPHLWYRTRRSGPLWRRVKPATMRVKDVQDVLDYLESEFIKGAPVLTQNGTSHDFRILAQASRRPRTVEAIALDSYDIAFQMMCMYGFPVGLRAMALGFNISGKAEIGTFFEDAWQSEEYDECFEYASRDVTLLGEVVAKIRESGVIRWVSEAKRRNVREFAKFLTVRECLQLPEPKLIGDISGIWTRQQFVGWMRSAGNAK